MRELDTRIPPRGFTNAAYVAVDAQPVGRTYADGQYWDDVTYPVGTAAVRADVVLYYQTTNKQLIEFLRDENMTNTDGTTLFNLWNTAGKAAPVEVARGVALADAKKIQGCRQNIDKVETKYLKTYKKQWAKCFAATAEGELCDSATRDAEIAEAAASLRARLGGSDDTKCEGMTPMTTGLGNFCPAPCSSILLLAMTDVADCSICLAENVIDDALESAYGTVPPTTPASVPAGAPATCQKQLGSAATTLAQKWTSALASCEKDNASGKTSPPVDCATDPRGKIAKAKTSAAKKVAKCQNDTGIEGCALTAPDNAALSLCIEDAIEDGVTAYPTIAYP